MASNDSSVTSRNGSQTAQHILRMTIQFGGESKLAEEILEIYVSAQLLGDLDQLAWNLSNCDEKRQKEEFGEPMIITTDIKRNDQGEVQLDAVVTFSGNNQMLIERLAEEYLGAFDDYVRDIVLGYESRTGDKLGLNFHPTSHSYKLAVV